MEELSRKFKTTGFDFAIVDRGDNVAKSESQYVAILDDVNMIDIVKGETQYEIINGEKQTFDAVSKQTELGRQIVVNAMTSEAVKAGAKVISASGCVDGGGDVNMYSDDTVSIFDAETVLIGEPDEMMQFMIDNALIVEVEPLTSAIMLPLSNTPTTEGLINIPTKYKGMYYQAIGFVEFMKFSNFPSSWILKSLNRVIELEIIEFSDEPRDEFMSWFKAVI